MDTKIIATLCFSLALIHIFSVKKFQQIALSYREGSVGENFFHLLGEIEVVFGLWAFIYLLYLSIVNGYENAIYFVESQDFKEPIFVFVIMTVCSTRPILNGAYFVIDAVSKIVPLSHQISFFMSCLIIGPLLGSFITEPAAMTVTALILLERYYSRGISQSLMYAIMGLLFVNISIGGTLTPYAAPPILMVASKWNWDLTFMLTHFGWKAILAIFLSTSLIAFRFRKELGQLSVNSIKTSHKDIPLWISLTHLLFLGAIVISSHHTAVFMGLFLFFLGLTSVTKEYQDDIKLREGLLVAFFLGGLVILGGPQKWWLEPILSHLDVLPLYLGSMTLTAITDNAALTYLGSQVSTLGEAARYALVAGSVVGGGLTVIANAPNPAGYGILNPSLGEAGISPTQLFINALIPTIIAGICFYL